MNKIVTKLKSIFRRLVYYFCQLLPIKRNAIIASNFFGRGYGDSPGAIIDELLKTKKNLNIYWVLDEKVYDSKLPEGVTRVKKDSIKFLYCLATSKIWINNVRNSFCVKKRREQFYIQTWHGGFGFKRIEKDADGLLPKSYIKIAKNDSNNIDVLLSNSRWYTKYFRDCFYYNGTILETGLPRNDSLFDEKNFSSIRKRVYKELGLNSDEKILLYAPTFRDDRTTSCYNIDYDRLIKNLEKNTKQKWKVLIRLHPNIADYDVFDKNNKNIINVSNYSSLNDLMISSDMLISDYSSLTFEYAYLLKPIILYAVDVDKYSNDRGFLFDIRKLPFPLVTNNDELEICIKDFSKKNYKKEINNFFKKYGLCDDGNASKRVVKLILKELEK